MNRTLVFFIALLMLFAGSAIFWVAAHRASAPGSTEKEVDTSYVVPEKELTEFEFTDQLAQPFGSKDLKGKIWMGTPSSSRTAQRSAPSRISRCQSCTNGLRIRE